MRNNGIAKFLTSAKAVLGILVIIVTLVVWFVVMNQDVKANKQHIKVTTPKVQDNRERILVIQSDITHIKGAVDKIYEKVK